MNIEWTERKGWELLATFEEGVSCVGMVVFEGNLFIALTNGAYMYKEGVFTPIKVEDKS